MEIEITKEQKELMKDIVDLYRKIILMQNKKLNFYEKQLLNIIEEYDFTVKYKKEWKKRND